MQYTARVEIHNGSYDQLHTAMASRSFSRVLTAEKDGKQYHMPIGEYWIESSCDEWAVLETAKSAAASVDVSANIVVSGGKQIVFYNCQPLVPARSVGKFLRPPAPRPKPSGFAPVASSVPLSSWTSLLTPPAPAPPLSNLSFLASLYDKR